MCAFLCNVLTVLAKNSEINVLEPGQGGGRQGRSVNIDMPKMKFVTHEAHRQGK